MSTRGREAALPRHDHTRPRRLAFDGLLVQHRNNAGQVKDYDFATLPVAQPLQQSLAALFASRCVPETWAAHTTSQGYWRLLVRFTRFLAEQPETVIDLDDLSTAIVRRWRNSMALTDKRPFTDVALLLRGDPRLQSGPIADELVRRIRSPKSTTQSYSRNELQDIKAAARRTFRTALTRIEHNADHLQRWRQGGFADNTPDWLIGHALSVLAETGSMPEYRMSNPKTKDGFGLLVKKYRGPLGGTTAEATWQRLFLSRMETTAMAVLLMIEYGWNLSVIDGLKVPRASPDAGHDGRPTYRVMLEKPRRGPGRHHESRNLTDDSATSPGRLITHALRATRFGRAVVEQLAPGTDRLIVWRTGNRGWETVHSDRHQPVGPFRFGVSSFDAATWAKSEGFTGSPFLRGRRTVIALNRREPTQHSEETYERNYTLVDKHVQQEAVEVIAAGAEDALCRANKAVLIADLRDTADPGDVETATADCADPSSSPFSHLPENGCTASFLMCLACPNAHIHPGHHSRLAHLHEALTNLQSVLPPRIWRRDWAQHHARLQDVKTRLGEPTWTAALSQVTDTDRGLIDNLLHGALDA
ncbi:hypothetical protein [Mycobacterium avium]|uniref:hypothetical protein n=1 Tax=Mycobacterium avium TaxID=1764 RepID=UPI001CC40884|nr:hypothetical protein [Mycobacterium avium]MBZ4534098.1 hypothetical protein [Mycobacterium avium subsp. hominissuis]MBZ4592866.1 hypothetical protein [Mycobacterium avium subsp. hominissuis]MBZ4634606.1 hypothetical protein [Mycobacterium avium subsp. hominissuis]